MSGSESGWHKGLVLVAVVCFFLAAPAPVPAATFPGQTVETTVLVPVGINNMLSLQLGRVLAPTPAGSPTVFFINSNNGTCGVHSSPSGNGECMTGGGNRRGTLTVTGSPNTTVFLSSNIPNPGSTSTTSAGVACSGNGTTPPKVTNIFFDNTIKVLNGMGVSTTVGVGAWFAVWDTSSGNLGQDWTCLYSIIADY